MKRFISALILCCIPSFLQALRQEVFSRSFMFTRPAYERLAMHDQLWHNIIHSKKGTVRGSMQATVFAQRSRASNKFDNKSARYFLIQGKDRLLVSGDANNEDFKRDVRAEWLNLPDNFRGELTMEPENNQVGFFVTYNQDLSAVFDSWFFNDTYFEITMPFVHATHDLHLRQENIQNPGNGTTQPRDILAAFNQQAWRFGKINGEQKNSSIAEIRLRMGRSFMDTNNNQLGYYTSIIIPTANKPDPEFLFNYLVGNGRHVGLNVGTNIQVNIVEDKGEPCQSALSWFLNLDFNFLIRNIQCRTIDLKHRPWARYMLYNVRNDADWTNLPGVNVLTLDTRVRPYGMFDFSTGFRTKSEWFEGEIGYSIWGHSQERIELREPFRGDLGIAGPAPATSASISTIAQQLGIGGTQQDPVFVPLTQGDLDLTSAAAGSALNHTFHLGGGMRYEDMHMAAFMGLGACIEWAQKNGALPTWSAWGKLGLSF